MDINMEGVSSVKIVNSDPITLQRILSYVFLDQTSLFLPTWSA